VCFLRKAYNNVSIFNYKANLNIEIRLFMIHFYHWSENNL